MFCEPQSIAMFGSKVQCKVLGYAYWESMDEHIYSVQEQLYFGRVADSIFSHSSSRQPKQME